MESYEDKKNVAGGSSTVFGAIFMSNHATKKECLKRKLFGLPPSQSSFVTKIKAGMILFLFEHEERKLYGVFQASSDGALNIVPNAFRSSGRKLPAQILFKTIWFCHPLPEHDFRDAIKDNYYTSNKFQFGLTEDQVLKLLRLFNQRKLKSLRSQNILSRDNVESHKRDAFISRVRVYQEDRYITTGSTDTIPSIDNDKLTKYSDLSRSNLKLSDASHKQNLETKSSIFEAPYRLSLASSASVKPNISDLPISTSYDSCDEHTNLPHNVYHSNTSSLFGSSSSLGINDESLVPDFVTCSRRLTDPLRPLSSSQLVSINAEPEISGHHGPSGTLNSRENFLSFSRSQQLSPFHVESENLMSQTKFDLLDASTSLGDYIPLTNQGHFALSSPSIPTSEIETFRNKSLGHVNLEFNKSLSFSESSVTELPLSRLESLRQDKRLLDASVSLQKYRSVGTRHSNYEFADASVRSSDVGQFDLHVGVDNLDPRSGDFYERTRQLSPIGREWECDDYAAARGWYHGDVQKKRLSVFSRLDKTQEGAGQDDDDYGYEDMSVNQLMDNLYQKQSYWRKKLKKYKYLTRQCEDGVSLIDNQQAEMSSDLVSAAEDEKCNEKVEIPLVNFKRRSKSQKVQNGESEGMPVISSKRRKLVRPSFATTEDPACVEDIMDSNCANAHNSSQEICGSKVSSGTRTNLVGDDVYKENERKSQDSYVENANLFVVCGHGNVRKNGGSSSNDFKVENEASQAVNDFIRDCSLNLKHSYNENVNMEQCPIIKDLKVEHHATQELDCIKDSFLINVLDPSPGKVVANLGDNDIADESSTNGQEFADLSLRTEFSRNVRGELPSETNQSCFKRMDDDENGQVGIKDFTLSITNLLQSKATSSEGDSNKSEEGSGNALPGLAESSIKSKEQEDPNDGFSLDLSLRTSNLRTCYKVEQLDDCKEFGSQNKITNGVMIDLNLLPEN